MSEYKLMGIYKISGQIKLETGLQSVEMKVL